MKDAIIGTAYNYSYEAISPFLYSLEKINYEGDLILFVNSKTDQIPRKFSYKIITINFEEQNKEYLLIFRRLEKYFPLFKKTINYCFIKLASIYIKRFNYLPMWIISKFYWDYYISTSRFILYYNFLKQNEYKSVFITDVRDVIFQRNIFDINTFDKLIAFGENIDYTLNDETATKHWIIDGYGMEVYESMKDNYIFCSGTILGNHEHVIKFLYDFTQHVLNENIPKKTVGFDQGIFNYFVSYKNYPYFKKSLNGEYIFTVGLHKNEDMLIINDKIFYAQNPNVIPYIIHQYDRHDALKNFVNSNFLFKE